MYICESEVVMSGLPREGGKRDRKQYSLTTVDTATFISFLMTCITLLLQSIINILK